MRITKLNIRNFGKIHDRNISLTEGVNVIYGENESGKSTIHTFIRGMLFGMERGRGRTAQKDTFSRYEPWENPNYYAGELELEVGDKHFVLARNFDKYHKDARLICQEDGEELSVENGDLDVLLDGLTMQTYDNTLSVAQMGVVPGSTLAEELKNYATNYYASGDSELNLNVALENLRQRDREIKKDVERIARERQADREHIEQEMSYVWRDLHKLTEEKEELREEIEERKEQLHRERERELENKSVIDELRPEKWRIHPLEILVAVFVVAGSFVLIPNPWNSLVAVVLALLFSIYIWNRMKISKKSEKSEPEILLEEITPMEDKVSLNKLQWELEHVTEELGEKQTRYDNLSENLGELDEISDEARNLEERRKAIALAAQTIVELSGKLQRGLREELNRTTSRIISEITDGRYSRLVVEEDMSMTILSDGRKISLEQVSQGTIEQIYFALRMAAIEILHGENYPIILDDAFGNYDDRRLAGVLEWLVNCDRQVILFTCQKREAELLKWMQQPYRRICL